MRMRAGVPLSSLCLHHCLSACLSLSRRFFFFFQFSTALVKCLWQQINQDINNPRSGLLKGKWGNGQWAAAKKGFLVPRSAKLSYELLNKFDAWNLKFECEKRERNRERERERECAAGIWQPVEAVRGHLELWYIRRVARLL